MGGKANVTTSGVMSDLLGLTGTNSTASVGLAREKPVGSWLLLSRFTEGGHKRLLHCLMCCLPPRH